MELDNLKPFFFVLHISKVSVRCWIDRQGNVGLLLCAGVFGGVGGIVDCRITLTVQKRFVLHPNVVYGIERNYVDVTNSVVGLLVYVVKLTKVFK